jgi:hypothetical protein
MASVMSGHPQMRRNQPCLGGGCSHEGSSIKQFLSYLFTLFSSLSPEVVVKVQPRCSAIPEAVLPGSARAASALCLVRNAKIRAELPCDGPLPAKLTSGRALVLTTIRHADQAEFREG